jgi:hypothetical protein
MPKAAIQIRFENVARWEGEVPVFRPGSMLEGRVEILPERDIRCRHLWIRATWHTEGRGNRDYERVATEDVFQGTLRARMPASFPFRLQLPSSPWSYEGHLLRIVWEVEVDVDIPWAINLRHREPFILAPPQRDHCSGPF